jgi:preprotein translocase subunit YajC
MNSFMLSAAASGASSTSGGAAALFQLVPWILVFVIFYFLMIRPQQKQAKEHQAKLQAVAKNDEVVTGGGLMGKVTKVADDYVEVEIAPNVRVKAVKAMLTDVRSKTAKPAND